MWHWQSLLCCCCFFFLRYNNSRKERAYFCHCTYVLRISSKSGFLWVVPTQTGILLRGLRLRRKQLQNLASAFGIQNENFSEIIKLRHTLLCILLLFWRPHADQKARGLWVRNYAMGHPKQRKFKFNWIESLCLGCPSGQLAFQHGGFLYHVTVSCKGPISGEKLTEGQNLTKYTLAESRQSIVISENQLGHISEEKV